MAEFAVGCVIVIFLVVILLAARPKRPPAPAPPASPAVSLKVEFTGLHRYEQTDADERFEDATIGMMKLERRFYAKVAGVTHNNGDGSSRQKLIPKCRVREELKLVPEPNNPYDRDAIRVERQDGSQLGYLDSRTAHDIGGWMRGGHQVFAFVRHKTPKEEYIGEPVIRGLVILLAITKK